MSTLPSPTTGDPASVFDLSGKTALVTGASSGMGRRFAQVLTQAGARVAVTARRQDRLEALAAENPGMVAVAADLTSADDRERLAGEVTEALGTPDILVNNAGVADPKPIEKETLDDFESMLELNLVAAWHLIKLLGPAMAERGSGSIVNIASIVGLVGATPMKQTGYPAAKGGLVNLTRELGVQWARKGVRVNALCPGWFATEMTTDLTGTDSGMGFIGANSPMPRVGEVHELDGPLLLLASDAGSFMTGSVLVVDGGWTAK